MNELLLESIQNVVVVANFLYVSVDEVTAITTPPRYSFICMLFRVGNGFHF
jgi:hypothetical protein